MLLMLISMLSFGAFGSVPDDLEQSRRHDLMESYRHHIDGVHDHQPGERGVCLTGLVQQLRLDWHILSDEERSEITRSLSPSKTDLFEPMVPTPAPPSAGMDTCWGTQKENRLDSEHFSVQWDNGVSSESNAQAFLDSLEESFDIEVDEMGWKEPRGTEAYQMLVMIENMGGGAGAYTTVDSCAGQYRAYVVASSGSFSAGDWYKTMACHELHHAIQYAYGFRHEFWWWEASATWMEDHVYPFNNDWANALYMFAQSPEVGMNASAGQSNDQTLFWHTYGMGIFGMYLDQHVGGPELVKETWWEAQGSGGQYDFWMPDVIDETGHDFDEIMAGFMSKTSVMEYSDRTFITDAVRANEVSALPADGGPSSSEQPQSLGMNFITFEGEMFGDGEALEVTFEGDGSADYWIAVLTRGHFTADEVEVFELTGGVEGSATISLEAGTPVHLAVSPVYEEAQGYYYNWRNADTFDYSWSAKVVDDAVSGGGDDTGTEGGSEGGNLPNPGDVSAADVTGGSKVGCACSTANPSGLGWTALLLGLVVGARRRD
jgi:MYXO-CTERM domain-containing protein